MASSAACSVVHDDPADSSHPASKGSVHRSSVTTTCRVSGRATPPTRHEIDVFMLHYCAHLPQCLFENEAQTWSTGARLMAPYLYTGADYALVLAACFPTRCVDLTLLNWSSSPLASQRQGNLRVFCAAARALALPDAPLSALHPELLQSNPACVVAHLKVQHWLYSLSLRFAPQTDHDAATLRAVHRHLQLGEPYLKRQRTESGLRQDACPSLQACAPLSAQHLQRCCGPALAPVPAVVEQPDASAPPPRPPPSSSDGKDRDKENDVGNAATDRAAHADGEGEDASRAAKKKPWLSYSKPWLLPSLRAAEAKRAASAAAAARREQEERERNPRYTAFAAQSRDVKEQYTVSKIAAAEKRERLLAVKAFIVQEIVEGKTLDFKEVTDRLKNVC
ncbi:hypothetical protein NQL31_007893 [Lotmaria passim]